MSVIRTPRLAAMAVLLISCTAAVRGADFQWNPALGSDEQWTNPQNWLSSLGGAPMAGDIAVFTQLPQPAESPVARGDPDPANLPPMDDVLSVGGIRASGFYSYDNAGAGLVDWRLELSRFVLSENNQVISNPFTLDLNNGDGVVTVGEFQEPDVIGGPVIAIPGGLTITGQTVVDNLVHSAPAGFRGTLDVRHGRLLIQDINYDDHDPLSTVGGRVDSRDDLSYIPQRLPNAELTIDHSHFDSFKTRGLSVGAIGRATTTLTGGTILSNLKYLRIGGDSSQALKAHEQSNVQMVDSHMTIGAASGGGLFVGDASAPDLINPYAGTLTLTRSSIAPSVIRNGLGAVVGYEELDVYVGNEGPGRAMIQDASSVTARRLFVGMQPFSFGELRLNSSQITLQSPASVETPDHAGRFSVGISGLGFAVITGSTASHSVLDARSMALGVNQNAYGDAYFDRDSVLTLSDSADVGIGGQGRFTVTGRFESANAATGRNVYHASTATIGTRPVPMSSDPTRNYSLSVGKVWASAGFTIVGEGARLDVTDQPLTGADEVDALGVERWRNTDHRAIIGDDGLGWLTVHADGLARAERLIVGQTALGVGHVVLNKVLLNTSAANMSYAVPGTLSVSRSAIIGDQGVGTLDVRGPYVPREGTEIDTFDQYGLVAASLTLGEQHGSSGSAKITQGGQVIINGTETDERDLIVAHQGVGAFEVSDPLLLSGTGETRTYVGGATGATLRVTEGHMQVGGADFTIHPAAKGTVTIYPNGVLDVQTLQIGSDHSSGDSLTVRAGATAWINGGTELHTFAGGTVRAAHIELRGDSTLAIETSPELALDPLVNGSVEVAAGIDVYAGALRLGTVERDHTGAVASNVTLHGGELKGIGTIDGDLLANGGGITFQVNGTDRFASYDSFDVTGVATFTSGGIVVGGSLEGQVGQQFDLFTFNAGSRLTSFDVVTSLTVQAGAQWVAYLDSDSYTLAVAGATGDTNFDGAVDFDDLLILAQSYDAAGVQNWTTGDFNDDATVNFDDLLLLAQNYGSSLLGESIWLGDVNELHGAFARDWAMAQSLAPEPTLAIFSMGSLARRRRRVV